VLSSGQPPATVGFHFSRLFTSATKSLSNSYRIHLSPGSRRNSSRTSATRKRVSATSPITPNDAESAVPPHSGSPPLVQGRVYAHHSTPDTTPPLTQATLPSASTLLHPRIDPISERVSATSSPSTSYSSDIHHILPAVSSSELSLPASAPLDYNYRSGTTSYQPANPYSTFVNNAPISGFSQNGSHNAVGSTNFTYSHSYPTYGGHSQQHTRSTSPSASMSSRHSLSHISNPHYASSNGPPSPTSVSSHTSHSGPPTPTYSFSYGNYTHPPSTMVASQPTVHNGQMSQSHLFQNAYTPNGIIAHSPRYSPPLTLAPIQDERYVRRLGIPRHSQSHNSSYLHHVYSPYHHSMGLGHGIWKTEAMRKGVGAAVI
jgi:zinc finger protein CreA/MIG